MPELPEVEVIVRGLQPYLTGRTITKIWCGPYSLRQPLPREKLQEWARERRIESITRRGKYIRILLDNGALLLLHLGMTGKLRLVAGDTPLAKHDHASWGLDNGMEFRFNDTRRFGLVQLFTPAELAAGEPLAELGPEPLTPEFSPSYIMGRAVGHRQAVKVFLMDNRQVVGIGNIYACELLFAAGIAPTTPASQLSLAQWEEVVAQARLVLTRAIAAGGSTIADYVNSSGEPGYFQLELKVYGQAGKPCHQCGQPITRAVLGGRATFFCHGCQH